MIALLRSNFGKAHLYLMRRQQFESEPLRPLQAPPSGGEASRWWGDLVQLRAFAAQRRDAIFALTVCAIDEWLSRAGGVER